MPSKKRRTPPKQADQAPRIAYSDEEAEEEEQGGFTLTGAEALSSSPAASTSAAVSHEMPCTLKGLTSGLSGGALGYVFGFGGQLIKHRGKGRWKACAAEGWSSAKTFAIMGGLYSAVSCFMQRLRQKDDAFNGGASGFATGIVLSWGGTPRAMLQSAIGFGLFSFVIDYMGNQAAPPAAAAVASASSSFSLPYASSPCAYPASICRQQWQGLSLTCCSPPNASEDDGPAPLHQLLTHPCFSQALLTPAAMWLRPLQTAARQHAVKHKPMQSVTSLCSSQ
ncbi:hypothetical protein WJX77_005087 [Trebouxia sp. C0004]